MAGRPIGSVTISFGLIAIPVTLYSATESGSSISFNLLHRACGSRLKQQYICSKENVVVERGDMVKGYEFEKNQYVLFTPEEIKALDEIGTHSIDIAEFVSIESVDPVYFEKSYYLAPDKRAGKPYALLVEGLKQTGRCAIGRWAARGNSNIVALRPIGNVLAMQQLRFADEVRSTGDIEIAPQELKAAELTLAKQLIEQQSSDKFDPTAYVDEVKARVEAAIQQKVQGANITVDEETPSAENANVIDIMEALRKSLERNESAKKKIPRLETRKAPKRIEQPVKAAKKARRN